MKKHPGFVAPGLLALAHLMFPTGTTAQLRQEVFAAVPVRTEMPRIQEQQVDAGSQMTTSGFFLGVVGMLGGAAVGSGVGSARCGTDCVGRAASGGATIAGSIMVPIGVHIAAQQPRNLIWSVATSVAAGSLVWAGFNALPGRPVALAPFVAAPFQVWSSLKFEALRR